MPRAKVKKLIYKESMATSLKKIVRRKSTLLALILIIAGIVLLEVSYNYVDMNVTHNTQDYSGNLNSTSKVTFNIFQPYNKSLVIYFSGQPGKKIFYNLTSTVTIPVGGLQKTFYKHVGGGNFTGNSTVVLKPTADSQGLDMFLNLTTDSSSVIPIHVVTEYNNTYVVHESKYLGIPGGLSIISGVVLFAFSITSVLEGRSRGTEE